MRLALLTPDWTPNGGVATHVRQVAAALVSAGHAVLAVHADAVDGSGPAGVTAMRVRGLSTPSSREGRAAATIAMDALCTFRPDVVHLHGVNHIPFERRVLAEFPAIKTFHVYDFCPSGTRYHHAPDRACTFAPGLACVGRQAYLRCTLSRRPSIWWRHYRRTAALNVHNPSYRRWIVVSQYVKREAERSGYEPERLDVVPCFTELPAASPAPKRGHILVAGRLVREKGLDLLFAALARVPGDWRVTVVGDGPWAGRIRAQAARSPVASRIVFAGWLTGDALARAFDDASIVAVPSRWPEPFGIIGLEAMAHARPVVAFDVGGVSEWLDDGVSGWRVPAADVDAFADRLHWLLERPAEAAAMGVRGRMRVARDFTAAHHLARLLPIYRELAGGTV